MNQWYEGSLWAFPGACTPQNRTDRSWELRRLFSLKLTAMVRREIAPAE
ncbi:MAG: hypothetical protein OXU51_17655 [Candidatus Poribacteria bacterium]|nr:hypothetical protein [Candidatus Poribacteria bacterium]